MRRLLFAALVIAVSLCTKATAGADSFFFSTGDPNGLMASTARIGSAGKIQIETGDDFVLKHEILLQHATFTGLLINGATPADIANVNVDLYHVFPKDSNTVRTPNVPTRTNSPADTEFTGLDAAGGGLSFSANILNNSFSVGNSVLPGGIHPSPNQRTLGNGPVTGTEVKFDVSFNTPFDLPIDHYFFVPTVELNGNGEFLWLSAPKPIVAPGTPFAPDLQSWTRDSDLDPDWLRIGADIVGGTPAPAFNASFTLIGTEVPEPSSLLAIGSGGGIFGVMLLRRRRV